MSSSHDTNEGRSIEIRFLPPCEESVATVWAGSSLRLGCRDCTKNESATCGSNAFLRLTQEVYLSTLSLASQTIKCLGPRKTRSSLTLNKKSLASQPFALGRPLLFDHVLRCVLFHFQHSLCVLRGVKTLYRYCSVLSKTTVSIKPATDTSLDCAATTRLLAAITNNHEYHVMVAVCLSSPQVPCSSFVLIVAQPWVYLAVRTRPDFID